MTEIFLPLKPRPQEDPAAAGVVQANLEFFAQLFEKGTADGDVLTWDALRGRWVARAEGGVENRTTLPGAPVAGQEIILTDSLTSPTYHWYLRYNASSSSSYKWECIGGTPAHRTVGPSSGFEATTSTTYTNLTTTGPDFTLPAGVGGDFLISIGCHPHHDIAGNFGMMSFDLGATGAVDADAIFGTTADPTTAFASRHKTGISSGALIRCKYRSTVGTNEARFTQRRMLMVYPYRVG